MAEEISHQASPRVSAYDQEWLTAANRLAARHIHGLETICPKCGYLGLVFSKWIKGLIQKPIFICHLRETGAIETCEIGQAQNPSIRNAVAIGRNDVRKLLRLGRAFVLFSGGRDSLCLLEYLRKIATTDGKEIAAIHANTTAGFPEVEAYVRQVCKRLKIALHVVHPLRDYFETAKLWGIPGPKSRWCCETLKVAPIRRFLQSLEGPKVIFDGIRAAESSMRSTYTPVWYHPSFKCISVSPIFHWSNEKVIKYISSSKLPRNPMAELGMSGECWCGAYKSRNDFEDLLRVHPDIFDKLVKVERAQKGDYTFIYSRGERITLEEVRATARAATVIPPSALR